MKRRLLTVLAAVLMLSGQLSAQTVLVQDSLLASLSILDLLGFGVFGAENSVDVHLIVYNTTDPQGNPTIASGALSIPNVDSCDFPLFSYQHGTVYEKAAVASAFSDEIVVSLISASTGYVACQPDYLGLGLSPGLHPYLHAESQATSVIDMLRAAKEFCANNGIELNDQLFLAGYSQGGHATMAAHKMIEEQFSSEFTVTASAPCSSPLSLDSIMAEPMTSSNAYGAPSFLPYIMLAYDDVYNIYDSIQQVMKEPWATTIPPLFNGLISGDSIDTQMPMIPSQALQDTFLTNFTSNPNHPIKMRLRENNLYDWTPNAPVHMWACEADELVSYNNSMLALTTMTANGATDVELNSAGANFTHGTCALPALTMAKAWFDSLKDSCSTDNSTSAAQQLTQQQSMQVFPNPAINEIQVRLPPLKDQAYQLVIRDMAGRAVRVRQGLQGGLYVLDRENLAPGIYMVEANAGNVSFMSRIMIQ